MYVLDCVTQPPLAKDYCEYPTHAHTSALSLNLQVQVVVHCAANTGFHVPLDEIVATNVGGWQQVLRLASGCTKLQVG